MLQSNINKLNKILEKWFKQNFNEEVRFECGSYFAYAPSRTRFFLADAIYQSGYSAVVWEDNWDKERPQSAPAFYRAFLKNTYHVSMDKYEWWMLALFHEIGHHFTLYNFSYSQYCDQFSSESTRAYYRRSVEEKHFFHFNQPLERAATLWMISYFASHQRQIKQLQEIFKKIFIDDEKERRELHASGKVLYKSGAGWFILPEGRQGVGKSALENWHYQGSALAHE